MARAVGNIAEDIAQSFLVKKNLSPITKNFYTKHGEIDLIMLDKIQSHIVFIEVRYRRNSNFCHPIETITLKKQQKLIKSAICFLETNSKFSKLQYRFDAVTIIDNAQNKNNPKHIEWFKNIITS